MRVPFASSYPESTLRFVTVHDFANLQVATRRLMIAYLKVCSGGFVCIKTCRLELVLVFKKIIYITIFLYIDLERPDFLYQKFIIKRVP